MLISKNIEIEENLLDRISQLEKETNLPLNAIVSEALELFIDNSTYAVDKETAKNHQ